MLFVIFKHHQIDFQLKVNDKFARVKLALKNSPLFYRLPQPLPIPRTLLALQSAYVFTFIMQIFTHTLYKKFTISSRTILHS